jgi:hypothetical protein
MQPRRTPDAPLPADTDARHSWRQPVRGTLILAAIGAGAGALLGATLLAAMLSRGPGGPSRYDLPLGLVIGGPIGAIAGGLGAPLLGWTLLREVPLGRALWMGAVGTALGAWAGAQLLSGVLAPVYGGLAGLLLGALVARYATRRSRLDVG